MRAPAQHHAPTGHVHGAGRGLIGTRWGLDLGGTKIEGVVLDEQGAVLARERVPTQASRGYAHILRRIRGLIELLESRTGLPAPARIGIGTPGTVDPPTGLMKNCNTTCLNGRPLPADLARTLGREVLIANDANCFALAEATLGAGRGYATVFGVILGTGVGGGLVVNGTVLAGAQGIAGEWGHNVLDPQGDPCYCGKVGCVETVLSGPALERYYTRLSGRKRSLKAILADRKDPHARATRAHLTERFGQALSVVVNIFDPHAIVLGGGVGKANLLYSEGRAALERWVFNNRLDTQLLRPALGDSAGVFGAALLVD